MSLMLSHQENIRAAREQAEAELEAPDTFKVAPMGLIGNQQLGALLDKALAPQGAIQDMAWNWAYSSMTRSFR